MDVLNRAIKVLAQGQLQDADVAAAVAEQIEKDATTVGQYGCSCSEKLRQEIMNYGGLHLPQCPVALAAAIRSGGKTP